MLVVGDAFDGDVHDGVAVGWRQVKAARTPRHSAKLERAIRPTAGMCLGLHRAISVVLVVLD